jgi:glycosyltransferase involved in cell wall biosynthesis
MLENKTIAVVVPSYNEETQIEAVINEMPGFVDRIVVVNDCSTDRTGEIVRRYLDAAINSAPEIMNITRREITGRYEQANRELQKMMIEEIKYFPPSEIINRDPENERIILIEMQCNTGVGSAIARGYKWCKDHGIDCTAVMAGDGQMDPAELESICRPVVAEGIDYVKGNRLIHRSSELVIPRKRFFGNSVLSILTKLASGYWQVSDTQTGYTAISGKALNAISLHRIYKKYGMPNDMLVKLNIALCTVREVEIKPVYGVGEKSKMKIRNVVPRISWLLLRSFFKRMWLKYFIRDFHPLFILYHMAFILFFLSIPFAITILSYYLGDSVGERPILNSIMFVFLIVSSLQSLLFAMWMDIQDNQHLYSRGS